MIFKLQIVRTILFDCGLIHEYVIFIALNCCSKIVGHDPYQLISPIILIIFKEVGFEVFWKSKNDR